MLTNSSSQPPSSGHNINRPSRNEIIIKHTDGWGSLDLGSIWEYRQLLFLFTWRELKGRYRYMAFGPLWIVLVPLINMVIFSAIFGNLANISSDGLPYPLFAYVALLPWQVFSVSINQSTSSLVKRKEIISKVYFPRLIVPISSVVPALVDFALSFGIMLGMMYYYGFIPSITILMLPVYLLLAVMTGLVFGMWLSCLAVKYRDVSIGITYFVQTLMFATPVVYPLSEITSSWRILYLLNPMTHVVEGFRWALLDKGRAPDLLLVVMIVVIFILLIPAVYYFRHTERSIIDLA